MKNDISVAKNIIKAARNIRLNVEIPNKQPLKTLRIVTEDINLEKQIQNVEQIILNELNIKNIVFDNNVSNWVKYVCKPNYQKLGPKLGKDINNLKNHLDSLDQADITSSIKEAFFNI